MTKRVKMVVAYDGTNYCGWQKQPNGICIEEVLNRELSKLLNEPIEVIGASRTDSGVHARGNIAVFDTHARMPADKICIALNQRLPKDIVIQESCEVAPDYHPRKRNTRKTYEYRILNRRVPLPDQRYWGLTTRWKFCKSALARPSCPAVKRKSICKRIPVSICLWTFRPACKGVAPAWSGG